MRYSLSQMGLGISFEGCACRSAFHAGVATALVEAGLRPQVAAGSSSGSLVACAMAANRAGELPVVWRALAGRSILSFRRALWNRSIFDMSHLVRGALREFLGRGDLRHEATEALAIATTAFGWKRVVFSSREEEDFVEPLLGSCFVPPFYGRPIRVRGALLLDGGFTDNLPLEPLVRRGADEIIAVVTSPGGTALKSPTRLRWRPFVEAARVHVIAPARPLSIGSWDFDPAHVAAAVTDGITAARRFLDRYLAGRA